MDDFSRVEKCASRSVLGMKSPRTETAEGGDERFGAWVFHVK